MNSSTVPTRFSDVAAALAANGYRPLPIKPGEKYPGFDNWEAFAFTPGCESRFPKYGAGVLLGNIVGVDIDVDCPDASAAIERAVREIAGVGELAEIPRRIGNAPRVLLPFRTAQPFKKMKGASFKMRSTGNEGHVEILADGQQFVAYHVHPGTKRPYIWNGGGDLLSVPHGALPEITETQAGEIIARTEGILEEWGDRITEARNEKTRSEDHNGAKFAEGGRNDALTREAGRLRWLGLSPTVIAAALQQINVERCDPPLDREEVETIARSIGAKPARDARPAPLDLLKTMTSPPLRVEDVPAVLGEFAASHARATGFDVSIPITAGVAAACGSLSDEVRLCVSVRSDWFESARLWFGSVGSPGSGKTPGSRTMLAPIFALHREGIAQWSAANKDSEEPPPVPMLYVNDATTEALADALAETPRGLLYFCDELESWLGQHDAYRAAGAGKDRGEWLRLYDGGPHQVNRIKRGAFFVANWGVSLLSATTPAALRKLAPKLPDDGLLQRILLVLAAPRTLPDTSHVAHRDPATRGGVGQRLAPLIRHASLHRAAYSRGQRRLRARATCTAVIRPSLRGFSPAARVAPRQATSHAGAPCARFPCPRSARDWRRPGRRHNAQSRAFLAAAGTPRASHLHRDARLRYRHGARPRRGALDPGELPAKLQPARTRSALQSLPPRRGAHPPRRAYPTRRLWVDRNRFRRCPWRALGR
jgi:hypothetical protein